MSVGTEIWLFSASAPITRVILLVTLFVGIHEYKFARIASFVLAIIFASFVIGALYK
jgi:hypothetical protein